LNDISKLCREQAQSAAWSFAESVLSMLQHTLKRALVVVGLGLAWMDAGAASGPAKASGWLGHSVITRDGKELGTVRDLAIDEQSGRVVYLVVSVGSFLIENNLIAVAPDALVPAGTDDGTFLLLADPAGLKDAKRFASDAQWPKKADVIRSESPTTVARTEAPEPATAAAPAAATTGTATIESRSKTAKLSASERVITETPMPAAPAKPATATKPTTPTTASRPPPLTQFDHLDKDGDGVLNRSEFAQVISPKDSYSKIDTNANGVIEPQEFDAYQEAHRPPN
jgi:PRC-barrel domain protein/EF hand domain-containing protein